MANYTKEKKAMLVMKAALEKIANVPYVKVISGSPRELFHDQVEIAERALHDTSKWTEAA